MKIVSNHIDGGEVGIRNLDAFRIHSIVQLSPYREPRFRFRIGNQIEHHFMADQGFTAPIHGDKGKQSVFNFVPFTGSWRKVTDPKRNADFICQPLQLQLPQPDTTAITPPSVRGNKQFLGVGEKQIMSLPVSEQIQLIGRIARRVRSVQTKSGITLNWNDLYGTGKGLWKGDDAQDYVNHERDSWTS